MRFPGHSIVYEALPEETQRLLAARSFGPRTMVPTLVAADDIDAVPSAGSDPLAVQSFLVRSPPPPRLKAGANVTITRRADEFEIAAGDDALAGQSFAQRIPALFRYVIGPASAIDNYVPVFDLASGKIIKVPVHGDVQLGIESSVIALVGFGDQTMDLGSAAKGIRDLLMGRTIAKYRNVSTAGWGVPAIYAAGRLTARTTAQASVATYTVGAADGSFRVSANVLVTTATAHNFTVTCAYTDEGNTARTLTFNFSSLAGVFATAIINTGGAVPYAGVPMHIRCKAGTTITIATTGTFTTVSYNVEGIIEQIA